MTAIVLGSAAGGGFPQWNCGCDNCRLAWAGDLRVKPRTQASLAVSADGKAWTLLNTSPDLRAQIQQTATLQPRSPRDSPIESVVLTGAEIDQVAGLLCLRERQPFSIHATAQTFDALAANRMFDALAPDTVVRRRVELDHAFDLPGGIAAELFAAPGKVPLYLEDESRDLAGEEGVTVGVELTCGGRRLVFVPGAATLTGELMKRITRADVVLFDGTLFTDDEMIASGVGVKTGRRMGHMPIDGEDGSLAALAGVGARRIYIHINNTNPILVDGSPQRRKVEAAGWEIGEDGMRIAL